MTISIIIPTYNEAKEIQKTIRPILNGKTDQVVEVLVVDSVNSIDNLEDILADFEVNYIKSTCDSRASQMNFGARCAKGDVLYFVHADTVVPESYVLDIKHLLSFTDMGCYRANIDSNAFLLKINSFFTRYDFLWCRGGDQTLFIKKEVFNDLGGYDESFVIMEEYDLLRKAFGKYKFGIIKKSVLVSARKYEKNGFLKIQKANFAAMRMFLGGKATPQQIKENYTKALNLDY